MDIDDVYAPPKSNVETQQDFNGENTELATKWNRFWAAIIDAIIGSVITLPAIYFSGIWNKLVTQTITLTETLMIAALGFIVFIIIHGYLLSKNGQTIGKRLIGIKIVDFDSNNILSLQKVLFMRYLPVQVVAQIPVIGGILSIIDVLFIFRKSRRCIHDEIAATTVIKAK